MPYPKPTLLELVSRIEKDILSRIQPGQGILRRSLFRVLARVYGGAVYLTYSFIDWLSKQLFPSTATSEYLDVHGDTWGKVRLQPTFAQGFIDLTGNNGTFIPTGTVWLNEDGGEYESLADATISGGTASVEVKASEAGAAYNRLYGSILTLSAPIAGLDDVATVGLDNITGGADVESDDAFRARILSRIKEPSTGGNVKDYETWVRDTPSIQVTRVWIFPRYTGPETVGIFFVLDNQPVIFPDPSQVSLVQNQVDGKAPATDVPTVYAPAKAAIGIVCTVSPDTEVVRNAVKDSLLAFFENTDVAMILYKAMLDEAISLATGEITHNIDGLTLNGIGMYPVGDIYLAHNQLPVLSFLIVNSVTVYTE